MNAKEFFTTEQISELKKVIKQAELNTSGEIRIHIENSSKIDVLDRAAKVFENLKMHKTELRNGVLFYLAVTDRTFAIIGDVGINKEVPENFWDKIKDSMLENFKEGNFTKGLSIGITMAGEQLKTHFPYQTNDINELSDEISFGKQ